MPGSAAGAALRRARWHRGLLVVPFVWQAGLAPLIDDLPLRPLGLPFPMAWQMAGIVLTTVVIAVVYLLDHRLPPEDEES